MKGLIKFVYNKWAKIIIIKWELIKLDATVGVQNRKETRKIGLVEKHTDSPWFTPILFSNQC